MFILNILSFLKGLIPWGSKKEGVKGSVRSQLLTVLIIAGVIILGYSLWQFNNVKKELSEANTKLVNTSTELKQERQESKITGESNTSTIATIDDNITKKDNLTIVIKDSVSKTIKDTTAISNSTVGQKEKEEAISRLRIDSLWDAYCGAKGVNKCTNQK